MKTKIIIACIGFMSFIFIVEKTFCQEGYFTTYGHEVEKGEVEFMIMFDHTAPSLVARQEGQRNYIGQMPKIGYNPTDQLELEFMVESFQEFETGTTRFTGFRFETRYRLFKKEIPLNPTIYFEYEDLDIETRFKMETSGWVTPPYDETGIEPDREKILESRLILSQNFGSWNISANWLNEMDVRNGYTAFGYSLGIMKNLHSHHSNDEETGNNYSCPMHPDVKSGSKGKCERCGMDMVKKSGSEKFISAGALTFELLGGLGDTKEFGLRPERQEHYFQPGIMLHLPRNSMFSVAFAFGLTDASDNLFRLMWMKMF